MNQQAQPMVTMPILTDDAIIILENETVRYYNNAHLNRRNFQNFVKAMKVAFNSNNFQDLFWSNMLRSEMTGMTYVEFFLLSCQHTHSPI